MPTVDDILKHYKGRIRKRLIKDGEVVYINLLKVRKRITNKQPATPPRHVTPKDCAKPLFLHLIGNPNYSCLLIKAGAAKLPTSDPKKEREVKVKLVVKILNDDWKTIHGNVKQARPDLFV